MELSQKGRLGLTGFEKVLLFGDHWPTRIVAFSEDITF